MSEPRNAVNPAKPKKIKYDHLNFRLTNWAEEEKIIAFVNDNFDWKLPLVNHRAFFEYYYCGKQLQFALAEQDGTLVAVAGYILANESETPDLWVSVWVALKGAMGAGLELMNAIPQLTHARVVACNNIRENTCTFYRFLGWQAERLPHFYRLSKAASEGNYQLYRPAATETCAINEAANTCGNAHTATAQNGRRTTPRLAVGGELALQKVADATALCHLGLPLGNEAQTPAKDLAYLQRRYFAYPYLHYDVWSVQHEGALLAYCVTRTVQSYFAQQGDGAVSHANASAPANATQNTAQNTAQNATQNTATESNTNGAAPLTIPVLRVVDFIGNAAILPRIGAALDALMEAEGAEYTDCYCAGIAAETFAAAGFYERLAPADEPAKTNAPAKTAPANETAEGSAPEAQGTPDTQNPHHVIIPNYLTPVLQDNTEYFYFTNNPTGFTLFKADGDQDRPNLP